MVTTLTRLAVFTSMLGLDGRVDESTKEEADGSEEEEENSLRAKTVTHKVVFGISRSHEERIDNSNDQKDETENGHHLCNLIVSLHVSMCCGFKYAKVSEKK